ncbi:MAG: histidinol-phosphate transaminase [Bdellovibrionaceae bacterium]|nr:histidinol-phosphate transaminase [Pseudobdellovibrionaceae bacterium]MBX3033099.1 histidinol-phosphate transaminase [Pseudobdellovibrionaceae bacterium]
MKVSPEILGMTPYKPGKPISETQREYGLKTVYKLASNENPLGPSPKALAAVRNVLDRQHLYPDPSAYDLLTTLSRVWSVPRERMSIGNGSDEIIDLLTRIYCEAHEGVLTSKVGFQAYAVSSAANRLRLIETPLTADWRFDLKAMADHFLSRPEDKIRLIFVANPNNPTGTYNTRAELDEFFRRLGGRDDVLLVFDEAYTEFVRADDYASAMEYIDRVPNLVVLRTFSKTYGLAGFRVGTIIAPKEVIDIYNRVRKPFNVNDLAQVAAAAAVEDTEFIEKTRRLTWEGLDYFAREFTRLGLKFLPSQGNFILFDTERDALKVYEALLKRGLILRPVLNYGLPRHLRINAGLPEENAAAIKALEEVLKEIPPLTASK